MDYLWTLRFRQPMGVKQVFIETETNEMAEAEALGRKHVNAQNGPGYRFICVERAIAASYKDELPAAKQARANADAEVEVASDAPKRASGSNPVSPAGRVGA